LLAELCQPEVRMSTPISPDDPLLSSDDLADVLGESRRFVWELNARGTGPKRYKIGRSVKYRRSEVDAWLESRAVTKEAD
jgi:predicted DNA-binding transcriptional regulator AlpA